MEDVKIMSLEPGQSIGPHKVVRLLGEGGMGQVWQATDTQLNRDVALKILPDAFAADPDRLARFTREAQILARLNHPNIAAIYGIEEAEGTRALVLELVEGPTLADRIAHGAVPIEEALPIARQIAEALEAAHEAGVIHRDLKPANIKVREDGTVKVLDFGLAKALDPSPEGDPSQSPTLTAAATQMGVIMGTAAYMSPEQAKGKTADRRSDVWAFGAVLYEMLAGRRAFVGEDVSDTLVSVFRDDPDWSRLSDDVPARVRQAIQVCLQKEPKQRVRDIAAVRLAMEGAFETTVSVPADTATAAPQQFWQRPGPALIAMLLVAVLTGLAGWSLRPTEPRVITRFPYDLPPNHVLRATTRGVLAVSHDGGRFVYNTAEGLYLRSMDALEARLLPGTEEVLESPVFSPDGQSLAYANRPDGQLKRLALSGGAPVVLGDGTRPMGVSWEADGTILFGDAAGIMRVSANGGTPELVIPAAEWEILDGPQLLPDGDSVLFTVGNSTGGVGTQWTDAQIVAESLTSGVRTVLLPGADARYVSTGHLVYALDDGLFGVAFDADSLTVVGGSVSLVQGVVRARFAASANYAVSDNGTLFYLAGTTSGSSLAWVDRAGMVDGLDTIPPKAYLGPRLSPNGERVLVVADGDAWIYDLASGRESPVTTDGSVIRYADWTPSGTEVAYSSSRGSLGENVWIQPADGSGTARQLTALDDGAVHLESWTPDGRTFAAHQHVSGAGNLLMIPVDGADAEPETWLEREFSDYGAVFSPDGRYVAHVSNQTGERDLYIRPFPGPGGQETVSVGGGDEPAWASNGELFYRRRSDYAMMVVEVSTDPTLTVGQPRELFRGGVYPGGPPRAKYAVTADGQRFLMSADLVASPGREAGTGPKVVVVQNWVEELKARVPVP